MIFSLHPGWFALAAALVLTVIGIMAIGTASAEYAEVQLRWVPVSLIVMFMVMLVPVKQIGRSSSILLGLCLVLLLILVIPGMPTWLVPPRNGARCWINLHVMNFQPSELTKIAFVLAIAWYLRYRDNYRTLLGMLLPFIFMLLPVAMILKQPDLGMSLLFAPALFAMLVAAGARMSHLSALAGLAVMAVVLNIAIIYTLPNSMQVLKPHQINRIKSMISQAQGDNRYIKDIGYQQDKAMTLIGAGRLEGYGTGQSRTIIAFNRLPESHNDMIFPVIINRWGFIGGVAVIGIYLVFALSFLAVALRSKDPFSKLATVGFAALMFTQAVINIGMTMGLLPITGLTLPFVSYGGSSLLTSYVVVGLVMNFASQRPAIVARPAFEFDNADAIFQ
ncbi:MAG: FtsW/RodA/SpoVE family cell cycle protein [Planctomycetes bacterium]|nr:FtsW/RodA/SpoVE family cell cycle protein [Planctomycetota bacterium]